MVKKLSVLSAIGVFVLASFCYGQNIVGRQQVITVKNGMPGVSSNALLWVPDDYKETTAKYPLIIYLHGKGENGDNLDDINRMTLTGLPMLIAQGFSPYGTVNGQKTNFLVLSPQNTKSAGWSFGYQQIKFMLQDVMSRYRVDADRIYITGISAGGWGVWTTITDDTGFCKKIAAVLPVSAAPVEASRYAKILNAAKFNIPVWSICGTDDAFWGSEVEYINNINAASPGFQAKLTGIKQGTHSPDVWNRVYDPEWKINGLNIYDWLLEQKRGMLINNTNAKAENSITYFNKLDYKGKKIYLNRGGDNGININGNTFKYAAGDTLVIRASKTPYAFVYMVNVHGTPNKPVTVINEGGQVLFTSNQAVSMGFKIENCSYLKITGTGNAENFYGFKEEESVASGVGAEVTGRSSNIEVCNLYIHNKTYGFWVKQEGSCIDSLQFPNWTIHDIFIHDNMIIGVKQEGMYLGSTDPNGSRTKNCNGVAANPKPLRLGNMKIYNNIIDSTFRGGIQLSGADYGDNEIYNNRISNVGFEYNTQQGNGIVIGGYTHAYIHNNNVRKTYTAGIFSLGSGLIRIENNVVDSSGFLANSIVPNSASIMVDTRATIPVEKALVVIKNNKTGKNTDVGIRFFKTHDTYEKGNIICNNTGTISVAKGIEYTASCPK